MAIKSRQSAWTSPFPASLTPETDKFLHIFSRTAKKNHNTVRCRLQEAVIDTGDTRSAIVALLPRLRRFARALTGTVADADDLVQIAVERSLRNLGQYQPGTRLDSWLFKVVKNAWIDEVRARHRRDRIFAPAEDGDHVGDDAAGAMDQRRQLAEVEAAMLELPEEQRVAIALICVEGLSYTEASEVLDVPIGTLSSRLTRGRETLMAKLGGHV